MGRVRGLHGLKGAVRVEVLTDRPETRYAPGQVLHREGSGAPLTVAWAEPVEDGPGWRLRFREIPDRQAAESLREVYLEIAVDRAADLEPGAAYWHEVLGAAVRDSAGRELGRVADVYRAGEAEVYVVRGGPAGEFDLPAVRDVITRFAPAEDLIEIDEGVLDLEAPPVDARPRTAEAGAGEAGIERRRRRWSRHGKGRPSFATDEPGDAAGPREPAP